MKGLILFLIFVVSVCNGCGSKNIQKESQTQEPRKQRIQIEPLNFIASSQQKLLNEHNKERELRGKNQLQLDTGLCLYAQKHAEKMSAKNSLYHSDISKVRAGIVGENVAYGQDDKKEVMRSWMNSTGHRGNILNSKYKKVGFGMSKNSKGEIYWCAVFTN